MSENIWDHHDQSTDGANRRLPGKKTEWRAILALACGVVALVPCGCLFTVPLAVGSLVLGYLALEQIEAAPDHLQGKLVAKIGMGIGLVAVVLSIVVSFLSGWSMMMF
jgi:hypothetical protein